MKNSEKSHNVELFTQNVQDDIIKARIEAKEEAKKMIDLARIENAKSYLDCDKKYDIPTINEGRNK